MELHPFINACLNALSGALLIGGAIAIRRNRDAVDHKKFMLGAFSVSTLFLISYIIRFAMSGAHKYPAMDWTRPVYLALLASHSLLAAILVPFAIRALYMGWKNRIAEHKKLVRWVFPTWVYVSFTGVLVYWMLYHLGPSRL